MAHTVMVTGADGFVGSHLTEELVKRGGRWPSVSDGRKGSGCACCSTSFKFAAKNPYFPIDIRLIPCYHTVNLQIT